ncbi:DNA polymerase III subunit delta [Entomobacter blattae]|uniref:DNA polymerase III subunit delta n=1 Tax=Entomobacter blattae TaxID=2762277 RepID=A0A7H1NQP5_9PROT|nr:DNA polymerase III subunit delta [Entomobacter blattae]QNT78105.1 DNA polymerase III, delta subunit [Entomobacter blattae]
MKIAPHSIKTILKDPGTLRAILLYGEDRGLIRERAKTLVQAILQQEDDPFRLAILEKETHSRLLEEFSALSLIGGQRVVWVRDTADTLTPTIKQALAINNETLLILEGPGLNTKTKLKALLEANPIGGCIGCYPSEGKTLERTVQDMLTEQGLHCSEEGVAWLIHNLSADQASLRHEIEKLTLYAGMEKKLTLQDIQACIEPSSTLSLEEALFSATAANRSQADTAIEKALEEGTQPVAIARATLNHFQRLLKVKLAIEEGEPYPTAIAQLRPPVFFKRNEAFAQAIRIWATPALKKALKRTWQLELECKQGIAPPETLARRHMAFLCHLAQTQKKAAYQ